MAFNIEFTTVTDTAIYVAQRVYTILGRMCLLRDLQFTLLYFVASQQFDEHLYLKKVF